MKEIVENPDLIPSLAGREVYIKPVADNAQELEEIYGRLVRGEVHGAADYVYQS